MMTLATTTPDGEPQAFGLPLLACMVSVAALLPAAMAWQFHGAARALLPFLLVQPGCWCLAPSHCHSPPMSAC